MASAIFSLSSVPVLPISAILLATLITLITLILYLKLVKKPQNLPPGPPRWPILGNLLQLGPSPHRDLASMCSTYGPLVYLRLGTVDAITTDDPAVIKEILLHQDDVFASRPPTLAADHLAFGRRDVAFSPFGPHWKRMRRVCAENLLTTRRLNSFAEQRAQVAQNLVRDIWVKSQAGVTIDLRRLLTGFSMNNVTRMLLGKQYLGVESARSQESREFVEMTEEVFSLLGLIYLGDFLPIWRWFDPYGSEKRMRKMEKRMDEFHTKIIEEHRENRRKKTELGGGGDEEEMDFVDVLLSLPGEDGEEHLDDVYVKAIMQDMLAAATDTSAVTNEWTMAEVIKKPSILRKIQEELDGVVGSDRMVNESDLPQLNYLRCVVREVFRVHPPGAFNILHESRVPTKLMGYDIPAKTIVFINTYALGRNPHIWEDADEFRPERHIPVDGNRVDLSHGSDYKILPFGAGKRKCPGQPLGVIFVMLALARLFHCFDWYPAGGIMPEEIDTTEVYGLTLPLAKPLMAVAKPRLAPNLYL